MDCRLLLAVRPLDEGKSRLSVSTTSVERISLNQNMLSHIFDISREVFKPQSTILVSRSEHLLATARAAGMMAIEESGEDLNAALTQGARIALSDGASATLSLSSDLPFLSADDLHAMLERTDDVVIATDVARQGTNAMLVRPPLAIPFLYGPGSLARHLAAAAGAGLTAHVIERAGLARDIDTPADLAAWRKG